MRQRKLVIYLASPYSHPDETKRELRYYQAMGWAARFQNEGHVVFSPIAHSHPMAKKFDMPKGWAFWREIDFAFIEVMDEVWVLTLPGWRESVGVQAEIEFAERIGKVVRYLHLDSGERTTNPFDIAA